MFGEKFKRKYALTDRGVHNTKMGMLWTVIVNLLMMVGMGLLYFMMQSFIGTLTENKPLPDPWLYIGLTVLFVILSLAVHIGQYRATYGLVYIEIKDTRIGLAERLRKLPLGYFGKRDLADLTETIMGDVNRLEHVWSHCLGYLYGSYISTAVIAVMLAVYDWRLMIACLWEFPLPLRCCSAAAGLRKNNLKYPKKRLSPFRTEYRKRLKISARSAQPIKRRSILKDWIKKSTRTKKRF